jgi:hypothetical protein
MTDYPEGFHDWPLEKRNEWHGLNYKETVAPKLKAAATEAATTRAGKKNDAPVLDAKPRTMRDVGKNKEDREKRTPQAHKLIALSSAAKLFHTSASDCYADIIINGHRETWKIRSKGFSRWLMRRYFEEEDGAPNNDAISTALGMLEAHAHYNSPERKVYVRVGGADGKIYLDLCDTDWSAVEIDDAGWRIVDAPPVRFRRTAGMRPLPVPLPGGTVGTLKSFLNVKSDQDFVLVVSWLLAALRDYGPYPIVALAGEHGSAKSTFSAILRLLVDPNTAPLRALPREDRDLFIAANNGHILAFDNVSNLVPWISDSLCRLATGGGFATRTLHSNDDETLFESSRPIILNGIEDIVTRPDLADRSLFITLDPIPKDRRRPENELYAELEAKRPYILGALLTALSDGLKRLPDIKLKTLPRMADFAILGAACESGLWAEGVFQAAYEANLAGATDSVIEADPIAAAVISLMAEREEWEGTSTDLLGELLQVATERAAKARSWPDNPKSLSGKLRRAAPLLREAGLDIHFSTSHKHGRFLTISRAEIGGQSASPASPASPFDENGNFIKDLGKGTTDKNGGTQTPPAQFASPLPHPPKPLKHNRLGRGDAGDAKIPASWRTVI